MSRWTDKIVMITGASAGLGLAIASAFAARGARPVMVARDRERLEAARDAVTRHGPEPLAFSADLVHESEARQVVRQVIDQLGRIDVLVNNVGRSTRTALMQTTVAEFREFMDVNFFSAVNCTHHALPHLADTCGHVVNVGSLAAKTAWPYLAPYAASKFALAGYTHQLRLEGPRNVHYMLVCPGPIQRDDSGTRYEADRRDLPERAYRPGAGARIRGVSPQRVARQIVRGCERRRREIVLPWQARILFAITSLSPPLGDWILKRLQ